MRSGGSWAVSQQNLISIAQPETFVVEAKDTMVNKRRKEEKPVTAHAALIPLIMNAMLYGGHPISTHLSRFVPSGCNARSLRSEMWIAQ